MGQLGSAYSLMGQKSAAMMRARRNAAMARQRERPVMLASNLDEHGQPLVAECTGCGAGYERGDTPTGKLRYCFVCGCWFRQPPPRIIVLVGSGVRLEPAT